MNVMEARRRTLGGGIYEKTSSGEMILANGSLARRYPGLQLYGQSTQESTTGAQLFDISKVISRPGRLENNGDSLHVTTITGDAAASGGVPNTLRDYAPNLKAGQTYYLSAASTGTDKYIHIGEIWNFNSSKVITEEMLQRTVMFYASGQETEADISEIMICEGTTAKPFEPYTGGEPSPSPDYPQEIVSAGKYNEDTQKWEYTITVANAAESPTESQTVTLTADRPLTKWDRMEKRNGQWGWVYKSAEIESYTDESVPGEYFSTTGQLSVGAQVWYETATETFVPLTTAEQEAMNALHTYRPTTVLGNQQGCQMTLTYKTRKSMEVTT